MPDPDPTRPDPLAALERVARILGTLALPVVLLVLGNWYTESQKDKDIGQRYVEIAVDVLSATPTEATRDLREWAVAVIDRHSDVKITPAVADALILREALPLRIEAAPQRGFRDVEGEREVRRIIVSDTQQRDVDAELRALEEFGVSYHYLVTEEGRVLGLVDENDVAFHSGRANADSIGIGVMHVSGEDYPPAQVEALAGLVRDVAARRGLSAADVVGKSEVAPSKASDFARIADAVRRGLP